MYELLRDQRRAVNSALHPKTFFMSHDEIRVANWCRACQSRKLTPGQLLADNARALRSRWSSSINPGRRPRSSSGRTCSIRTTTRWIAIILVQLERLRSASWTGFGRPTSSSRTGTAAARQKEPDHWFATAAAIRRSSPAITTPMTSRASAIWDEAGKGVPKLLGVHVHDLATEVWAARTGNSDAPPDARQSLRTEPAAITEWESTPSAGVVVGGRVGVGVRLASDRPRGKRSSPRCPDHLAARRDLRLRARRLFHRAEHLALGDIVNALPVLSARSDVCGPKRGSSWVVNQSLRGLRGGPSRGSTR